MSNQLWRDKYKAVYVSPDTHRDMAVQAAHEGRQIMELAEDAFAEYRKNHPISAPTPTQQEFQSRQK